VEMATCLADEKMPEGTKPVVNMLPSRVQKKLNPPDSAVKIKDGLKPKTLNTNSNPGEYRHWKGLFTVFFDASNLNQAHVRTQHGYLAACMDPTIMRKIQRKVGPEARVFSDDEQDVDNCMSVLDEIFLENFPMGSRRRNFVQQTQGQNKKFSTFLEEMHCLADEAEIWDMTGEELFITILVSGCNDQELKKELTKEEGLTQARMEAIVSAYEQSKAYMKQTQENARAYAVKQNNPKSRGNNNKSKQSSENYDCFACGRKGHKSEDCKIPKKDLFCQHCKINGHNNYACKSRKGGDGNKSKKKQSNARRVTEDEDDTESDKRESKENTRETDKAYSAYGASADERYLGL